MPGSVVVRSGIHLRHPIFSRRVDLLGGTKGCAREDPGVGGKRERNLGQIVHPQSRGDGDRHHLDDLDGPLPHDMAAQDRARRAVGDQLAEPGRLGRR